MHRNWLEAVARGPCLTELAESRSGWRTAGTPVASATDPGQRRIIDSCGLPSEHTYRLAVARPVLEQVDRRDHLRTRAFAALAEMLRKLHSPSLIRGLPTIRKRPCNWPWCGNPHLETSAGIGSSSLEPCFVPTRVPLLRSGGATRASSRGTEQLLFGLGQAARQRRGPGDLCRTG